MQFVGKFISTVSEFYKDINPATLSGAIDVVVIEQPDGTLACSPFHVRFGKLQILRLQGSRVVDIAVNGVGLPFKMRMGEAGEAYFVRETADIVIGDLIAIISGPNSPDSCSSPTQATSDLMETLHPVEEKTFESSEIYDLLTRSTEKLSEMDLNKTTESANVSNEVLLEQKNTTNREETLTPFTQDDLETTKIEELNANRNLDKDSTLDSAVTWHRGLHSESSSHETYHTERPKSWSDAMVNLNTSHEKVSVSSFHTKEDDEKIMPEKISILESPLSDTEVDKVKSYEQPLTRSVKGWRTWFSRSDRNRSKPQMDLTQLEEERAITAHNDYGLSPSSPITLRSRSVEDIPDLSQGEAYMPDISLPSSPHRASHYVKSLRLTSQELKQLNLNYGLNSITYSVTSPLQGRGTITGKIYLWKHDVNIVVSDIDGTITKSDALGHLFTMVGKDWTHIGVANLYSNIARNGYNILYLTSRAIGQAASTREYLSGIHQGAGKLPDGPIIMSPDRLLTAVHRELIIRRPEEFKIACLRDIRRLFPENHNPFFAGFGNRITDALAYRSVDIPTSKIFTIDYRGHLRLELVIGYRSSYVSLNDMVDHVFPPLKEDDPVSCEYAMNIRISEQYNDFNYWKKPLPDISYLFPESSSRNEEHDEDDDIRFTGYPYV